MIEKIVVPGLGMSFEYVTLTKWVKNEGDYVKKDEPIAEATSDKITMEITSTIDGYLLKQMFEIDDQVPTRGTVAIVGSNKDEEIPNEFLLEEETTEVEDDKITSEIEKEKTVVDKKRRQRISPVAKRMIAEHKLDSREINGTGSDGMVTREDVEEFLKSAEEIINEAQKNGKAETDELVDTIPYTGIRKVIGDNLIQSIQNSAHVTTGLEVDMTNVIELRKKLLKNEKFEDLSILTFVLRAAVEGIREYPILNSEIKEDKILIKKNVNIGIAVSTPDGLIVPVIKGINNMNFGEIAKSIKIMTEKGRTNKVEMKDLEGGTISISNAGSFGATTSTPIINKNQSSILWMGKAIKKPTVVNDEIIIRSQMNLLCSYDHRIIDGSTIAMFLTKMKTLLESPEVLLIT